jgi:hypothetical protein
MKVVNARILAGTAVVLENRNDWGCEDEAACFEDGEGTSPVRMVYTKSAVPKAGSSIHGCDRSLERHGKERDQTRPIKRRSEILVIRHHQVRVQRWRGIV